MIEKLEPCPVPWCKSDVLEVIRSPWSRGYGVHCQNCRAQGPDCATEAEAIAAWNTRTPANDSEAVKVLREARSVIDGLLSPLERAAAKMLTHGQFPNEDAESAFDHARAVLARIDAITGGNHEAK